MWGVWKKVKSLSRGRLSAIPWTVAYQAPPSAGFSRQEYWSGVPLPSPVMFIECLFLPGSHSTKGFKIIQRKYRHFVCVLVTQLCLILCNPMDYSPPDSSVHGTFQARILEWLPFPSPGDLPEPEIKPGSAALQADCLTVWATRAFLPNSGALKL